jgi:hypothetical protein
MTICAHKITVTLKYLDCFYMICKIVFIMRIRFLIQHYNLNPLPKLIFLKLFLKKITEDLTSIFPIFMFLTLVKSELVIPQLLRRGESLVTLFTLLLLLLTGIRMRHQPMLLQLANPRGLVAAQIAGEAHAHVRAQLVTTQHAGRDGAELALVAHEPLLLVADLAVALEAVGARGEEVAEVAAVGDALVYGEAVLAQVGGIARLVPARVAHVLRSFLEQQHKI